MKKVAFKSVPDYASLLSIPNPIHGELCYVKDLNKLYLFNPSFDKPIGWSPIEPSTDFTDNKLHFVCEYCGGRFFDTTLNNCPNCGAPLKIRRV